MDIVRWCGATPRGTPWVAFNQGRLDGHDIPYSDRLLAGGQRLGSSGG
jgi:hypothetical protein